MNNGMLEKFSFPICFNYIQSLIRLVKKPLHCTFLWLHYLGCL